MFRTYPMFVLFFPTLPIKYNRKINKIKIHKIHKPKHISSSFIGSVNTNKILRIQKAFQYIIGGVNTNKILRIQKAFQYIIGGVNTNKVPQRPKVISQSEFFGVWHTVHCNYKHNRHRYSLFYIL